MEDHVISEDRVIADAAQKRERVRVWLQDSGYDGVVMTTRKHFAWVTGGGDNHVLQNSEMGFCAIVITPTQQYLVAHSMDAERLWEEQASGQGYELVPLYWHEGDIRSKAVALAGARVASDTEFPGTDYVDGSLVDLHYPMSALELDRLRWLGQFLDGLFTRIGRSVTPGQTEREIAHQLQCAHLKAGIQTDVLIAGSDERPFKYRHPLPTEKRLEKYLMLHTAARRWGLHCNLTRFVHFGPPTERIRRVTDAAGEVAAKVILSLKPGVKFSDILSWQKEWYAEAGFPGEWHYHYQGGPTGYVVVDGERCLTSKVVQVNQPYEWFITVTGTKAGELVLLTESGPEVVSFQGSDWPGKIYQVKGMGDIALPDIMIR